MGLYLHQNRFKSGRAATIFLIVFALVFCAVGCVALGVAVILLFEGNYRDMAFAAPFALAFGGFGINLLTHYFSSRAAGAMIPSKREADWIVDEIMSAF
jgi:hypothetical protein